jgi:hypothetical protein
MSKGVFAFCPKSSKWRFGLERVSEWTWLMLGPFAINMGKW